MFITVNESLGCWRVIPFRVGQPPVAKKKVNLVWRVWRDFHAFMASPVILPGAPITATLLNDKNLNVMKHARTPLITSFILAALCPCLLFQNASAEGDAVDDSHTIFESTSHIIGNGYPENNVEEYSAQPFFTGDLGVVSSVSMILRRRGEPRGSVSVEIWDDDNGAPGSLVAKVGDVDLATLPITSQMVTLNHPVTNLEPNSLYYLVNSFAHADLGTGGQDTYEEYFTDSLSAGNADTQGALVFLRGDGLTPIGQFFGRPKVYRIMTITESLPIGEGDPNLVTFFKSSLGQVAAVPSAHEGRLTIRNHGDTKTLEISVIDVRGADPDHFTIDAFPATLAPGAVGEVTYTFDSKGESGAFAAELIIKSNDEFEAEFVVATEASVINRNGPVAHYRFDEPAGSETIHDASGWGRHGTVAEGALLGGSSITGLTGASLKLSAGGQVMVPGESFDPFHSFTLSAWVQSSTLSELQALVAFGSVTPDFALFAEGDALSWFVGGEPKASTGPVLSVGETTHIALTYSSEELTIYVDGEPVLMEVDPDPIESNGGSESVLSLGAVNGLFAYEGILDEVQVYHRAIPAEDVMRLFTNPQKTLGDFRPVDSDGDGLSDEEEDTVYQTDPLVVDTDGDLVSDGDEVAAGFNPVKRDTDGGGAWDGYELSVGTDPTDGGDDAPVWTVRTLKSPSVLNSIESVEKIIADQTFTNKIIRQHPAVNFVGTGSRGRFDSDLPFDNINAIESADVDDFAVVATSKIFISEPGLYTFGFHSDDGGRLSVNGRVVTEFDATRSPQDSLGTVNLAQGFHSVEVLYFERSIGSIVEVYWNPNPGDSADAFDPDKHQLLMPTDVDAVDSDNDTIDDNWELAIFGDLSRDGSADDDGDGLSNKGEHDTKTDPHARDTDGDGLEDGPEVDTHHTSPTAADTDGDERSDGDEVNGDIKTDPLKADTDGDTFRDGFEVAQGSDPNDATSLPTGLLGEPSVTWNEISALPSLDNFQGTADKQDVTFRVFIDFNEAAVSEDEREVIWESGGGFVGFSLVYETGNTLVLRAAGSGGQTVTEVFYELTADQIAAGELSVIWTFDVNNEDPATGQSIALYLDHVLVGQAAGRLGADWTGNNVASFGARSDNFAAAGGGAPFRNGVAFVSGTINLERGLEMFVDTLFEPAPVPPTSKPKEEVVITEIAKTDGGMTIVWTSNDGQSYDVEFSENLATWAKINPGAAILAAADGRTVFEDQDADRTSKVAGYYRVVGSE